MRPSLGTPAPRPGRTLGLAAAAACLLAVLGLLALPGQGEPSPLMAARDGYAVLRGAPTGNGAPVTVSERTLRQGALLLVGPDRPLPRDHTPPDVRAVRAMVGQYLPADQDTALCRDAVYALCALHTEHPLTQARFTRGAVSAAQQEQLRREAFERYRQIAPLAEALARSRAAVPGGGESEHQTGYAVDVELAGPLDLGKKDPLLRNADGVWLDQNLWRFGFIRRYREPENGNGGCEGIHLRYVGPVHAAAMHALGVDLEEYWALLRREGALTLTKEGRETAYIYCSPCAGDWTLRLPDNAAKTQFSADNTGWAAAAAEIKTIIP